MDIDARLEALVAPLRDDTVSGASVVAGAASEVLHRGALEAGGETPSEVRASLGRLVTKVLAAQPAMAPLVALCREVLEAASAAADAQTARGSAAHAADLFRERLDERQREVARRAARLLPGKGTVLTVSSSATVRDAILFDAPLRELRVVCLEGRPMHEGRVMAEALAGAGIDVVFAVDAAADALLRHADLVLLGADSIGDLGVVNKIGSLGVALAARRRAIPVHVAADETKILPRGFPQHVVDDRPSEEVWVAPSGVSVWNRYFEVLPLEIVTSVVTDEAIYRPEELERRRAGVELPEEIRAWGAGHDADGPAPL
jgi:translation initiation factor 2B subunit (eIF-2B alpha/beta/delta family)